MSLCRSSASETSDVRDLQMTSFLADCVWQILVQDLLSTALSNHCGAEVRWHLPRPPRARAKLLRRNTRAELLVDEEPLVKEDASEDKPVPGPRGTDCRLKCDLR